MAKYILYGNGIDDDYPAIQEMLDSGMSMVELPVPEKCYLISKTLKIHGGQTLKLGATTEIYLTDYADCAMLENADFTTFSQDICVDGGIWDMNSEKMSPNPWHFPGKDGKTSRQRMAEAKIDFKNYKGLVPFYTGKCMRFCRVKNFVMKNVTFRNPVTYGVQVSHMEYFTFRDIIFDYYRGAPKLWNMDGIHIEGNCKHGYLNNLKGTTHDDLVAITADDGAEYGPIEDILVDGIFAEGTHSAVRILSHGEPVRNIRINNIYGTYNSYCIGITKYHGGPEERGIIENVIIDNVSASCAVETVDVCHQKGRPFIWIQNGLDIYGLTIKNVFRDEHIYDSPTIGIEETAVVNNLNLKNIHLINNLGQPIEPILINGKVENARIEDVYVDRKKIK